MTPAMNCAQVITIYCKPITGTTKYRNRTRNIFPKIHLFPYVNVLLSPIYLDIYESNLFYSNFGIEKRKL